MSDEEFGEGGFGGGEEVREEEVVEEAEEEMQEVEEELGADDAENELGAEEEYDEDEFGEESGEEDEEEFSEEEGNYSVEKDNGTISVSESSKRNKEESIDRLSALPDTLLFRILNRLDRKEAARTSLLSRSWQFIWMHTPRIKLRESSKDIEKLRRFVAWINRILIIGNGNYLMDFEVEFTYYRCFASDVNAWMESVVKNKVNGISLLLNSSSSKNYYRLPLMFFCNSTLTRLRMRGCILAPQRTINWPSLTRLYLEEIELPQDVLKKILSGCPDLSNLFLKACWGFNCLNVTQKLDTLGVGDGEGEKMDPLLEISAPNTDSITVMQYPKGRQWRLTNIPSVVTASIDFSGSDWDASSEEVMSKMRYLLENFRHAKELVVGCRCVEVLSMMAMNGWELPQYRRESLVVNVRSDEHSIPGILALLESSPNLENLILNGNKPGGAPVTLYPTARRDLDCELLHLKSVHIAISPDPNLAGQPMLKLVEILLKRAIVLEKMVIDVAYTSDFVNVIQTLLGYPRSSKNASIILN